MVPITGLYEVAIKVRDLKTAERFYCEVLGLQFGLLDERRNWLFLRAGELAGMVVLAGRSRGMATSTFCFHNN